MKLTTIHEIDEQWDFPFHCQSEKYCSSTLRLVVLELRW